MMFKKYLLAFLVFISMTTAQAGLLIEPYLGMGMFGSGDTTASSIKYTHEPGGVTFGGRVGYQFLGFMAGVDYSMGSQELTSKELGITEVKNNIDRTNLAVFVGYNLPIMLRVWGSYFISADVEGTDTSTTGSSIFRSSSANDLAKASGGSGIALGVGWTSLPFVSLNAEYRSIEYTEFENKNGATLVGITENPDFQEVLLSVSLPFDI